MGEEWGARPGTVAGSLLVARRVTVAHQVAVRRIRRRNQRLARRIMARLLGGEGETDDR